MKILVVCQYYYPEPFRISDICETLVQNGHDVTVLTGLPNYPEGKVLNEYRYGNKRIEVINGVKVIRNFVIGRGNSRLKLFLNYFSFAISASLKAFTIKDEFDVILVNQLSPVMMSIPAMVYKRKHNKKILLYCLDLWPASLVAGNINEESLVYQLFIRISKWIYNSADMILVSSSMFIDYFKTTLQIRTDNVQHLPQYAEDLFSKTLKSKEKNNKYNFVFAGNVGDMQSVDTIIKAANELKNYPEIIFHIVGEGSKSADCKQLIDSMGLVNVLLYGRRPVEEMPDFYAMADAMLITLKDNKTLSYTLPGKIQSYMAAGKPVIGSINGETRRVIEKSGCGLCCNAEDYKGLAKLILQFCNSDEKDKMGENAKRFYIENYSKERFIAELEDTLLNVSSQNDSIRQSLFIGRRTN